MISIIKKIFGSKRDRDVTRLSLKVAEINAFEEGLQALTEDQLKAKTEEFKGRLNSGETLDDIMCEAFAVVKNACRRLRST